MAKKRRKKTRRKTGSSTAKAKLSQAIKMLQNVKKHC